MNNLICFEWKNQYSLFSVVCQAQCIAGIVEYIKAHPNASEADLTKEVEKHVALFKERVQSV